MLGRLNGLLVQKHHADTRGSPTRPPALSVHCIMFITLTGESISLNWGNRAPIGETRPILYKPSR